MAARSHTYQPPKGTRDFYPPDMAVRRHLESIWRTVSINHGFEEIDGPTFEHLDLYTVKSGDEIVSQLFRFQREGGDTEYALRPEFTPTLARMYAARAGSLPSPTRWFCIPNFFRAERPQRGRLREFWQWNADIIGDPSPRADAEVIAVAVNALEVMGLPSKDITIRISHRGLLAEALTASGVAADRVEPAMVLLDRREKMEADAFAREAAALGLDAARLQANLSRRQEVINSAIAALEKGNEPATVDAAAEPAVAGLIELARRLHDRTVLRWCEFDFSIVRGLAYYTGTVFEIHEATGKERAIAGGGRYDGLVALYGGPPTPAVGFAMGDVVIRLVLEDKGLLQPAEHYLPRPDAFIISTGDERAEHELTPLLARLRREGLHVRTTARQTRNVGKLLGDAARCRARHAVILGAELADGNVVVKNLDTNDQRTIALDSLLAALRG